MKMSEELKDMQIYTAIENLLIYLDECKPIGFSGGTAKRVVLEEINSLISEIKIHIPEEMRRAQAIISEAEDILDSANERADELVRQANVSANGTRERAKRNAEDIIREAELERQRLLDEHEITVQAKKEADEMIAATQKTCQDTYEHAQIETAELLDEAERCLHMCVKEIHSERDRVGVRKMQTRYEPARDEWQDGRDEPELPDYESEDADYEQAEDYEQEEKPVVKQGTPIKPKKKAGIKISEFAKKYLYTEEPEDSMFADDSDSFNEDEEFDG